MASDEDANVPESGALFTYGLTVPDEYEPSKFWLKNDVIVDFACGDEHSVFITRNGKAFSYGKNDWGQLGLGHTEKVNKPTLVKFFRSKNEKVLLVSCGRAHSLFYTDKLRIYGCGCNTECQILPDGEKFVIPMLIDSWKSTPVKQLACGVDMSALLTKSGEIYVWGGNDAGQLGLGEDETADKPEKLDIRSKWSGSPVWISCGPYHCGAVLQDGRLLMWGEAESGKLGFPDDGDVFTPHKVNIEDCSEVHCGLYHTLAITKRGEVYTWGDGKSGQLGLGKRCMQTNQPMKIQDLENVTITGAAVGDEHSFVISDTGILYSFGDGQYGKLGASEEEGFVNQIRPFNVERFLKFTVKLVACGHHQTLIYAEPANTDQLKHRQSNGLSYDSLNSVTMRSSLKRQSLRRKRNRNSRTYKSFEDLKLPDLIDLNKSAHPPGGGDNHINGDNKLLRTAPILRKPTDLSSPRQRNKTTKAFCEKFDVNFSEENSLAASMSRLGAQYSPHLSNLENKILYYKHLLDSINSSQLNDTCNFTLVDDGTLSDYLIKYCSEGASILNKAYEKTLTESNNSENKDFQTDFNTRLMLNLLSMLSEDEILYAFKSSLTCQVDPVKSGSLVKKQLDDLHREVSFVENCITCIISDILELFGVYENYLLNDLCGYNDVVGHSASSQRNNIARRLFLAKLKPFKLKEISDSVFNKSQIDNDKGSLISKNSINYSKDSDVLNKAAHSILLDCESLTEAEVDGLLSEDNSPTETKEEKQQLLDESLHDSLSRLNSKLMRCDSLNNQELPRNRTKLPHSNYSWKDWSKFDFNSSINSNGDSMQPNDYLRNKEEYSSDKKLNDLPSKKATKPDSTIITSNSFGDESFKLGNLSSSEQPPNDKESLIFSKFNPRECKEIDRTNDEKSLVNEDFVSTNESNIPDPPSNILSSMSLTIDCCHARASATDDNSKLESSNYTYSECTSSERKLNLTSVFEISRNFRYFIRPVVTSDSQQPTNSVSSTEISALPRQQLANLSPSKDDKLSLYITDHETESLMPKNNALHSVTRNSEAGSRMKCQSRGDHNAVKRSGTPRYDSHKKAKSNVSAIANRKELMWLGDLSETHSELKYTIFSKAKLNTHFEKVVQQFLLMETVQKNHEHKPGIGETFKIYLKLLKSFVCCCKSM